MVKKSISYSFILSSLFILLTISPIQAASKPRPSPSPSPTPTPTPTSTLTPSPTPTPTPTSTLTPSPTPTPTSTPTPTPSPCASGGGGCDDPCQECNAETGECELKEGYTECGNDSESETPACCGPNEQCCGDNEGLSDVAPTCCSTEKNSKGELLVQCKNIDMNLPGPDGKKVPVKMNYCGTENCAEPTPQKCTATNYIVLPISICCKDQPENYCGVHEGPPNTPFCATDKEECGSEETECQRDKNWPSKDTVLCCNNKTEVCTDLPVGVDKKYCKPIGCKYGEPCKGLPPNDFVSICCDEGQGCENKPDGFPICRTSTPASSTSVQETIVTNSFSLYLPRNAKNLEFDRSGPAYRFRPHGLTFAKNIQLKIKDATAEQRIYKYSDESYIDSCSIEVVEEWILAVGPSGTNIKNEYFELTIPAGSVSAQTPVTIDKINIYCPNPECSNPLTAIINADSTTPEVLDCYTNYEVGNITEEEFLNCIELWENPEEPSPTPTPTGTPTPTPTYTSTAATATSTATYISTSASASCWTSLDCAFGYICCPDKTCGLACEPTPTPTPTWTPTATPTPTWTPTATATPTPTWTPTPTCSLFSGTAEDFEEKKLEIAKLNPNCNLVATGDWNEDGTWNGKICLELCF